VRSRFTVAVKPPASSRRPGPRAGVSGPASKGELFLRRREYGTFREERSAALAGGPGLSCERDRRPVELAVRRRVTGLCKDTGAGLAITEPLPLDNDRYAIEVRSDGVGALIEAAQWQLSIEADTFHHAKPRCADDTLTDW
jgi:hypothetical protein